jgi:hypothetical protein
VLSTQQVNTLVTPTEPIGMTWLSVESWLLVTSYNSDRLHQMYGSCNAPTAEGLHCDEVSLNPNDGTCQGIDNEMDCVKDTSSYSTHLREQMLLGLRHRDMGISTAVE